MFNPDDAQDKPQLEVFPESADNLHLAYRVYEVREAGDIDAAFARLMPDKIQAIYIPGSPTFNNYRKRIAEKIAQAGLPTMGTICEQAVDGCLMTYGASIKGNYRQTATYVANILKGMKPADLPMERRECLDHVIVLGEVHLRRVLKSYADYYNSVRTHRSLDKDAPVSRPVQRTGSIKSFPILGGLHHHYVRV